jgi:hypothetical protein
MTVPRGSSYQPHCCSASRRASASTSMSSISLVGSRRLPRSFELVGQSASAETRFWIPLQASIALLLIASLVLNWSLPARTLLVTAFVAYLVVWVTTGVYFAPEIVRFSQLSPDVAWTELATRAHRLVMFSWIRPLCMVSANVVLLVALARS